MNNTRQDLFGIDATVQGIQKDLYEQLKCVWSGDVEGYGRVYKNLENSSDDIPKYYKSSKIFIPEWYNAYAKDYEDLYYDDNKSCSFCFIVGDTDSTEDSIKFTTKAKVVFMVDLNKIYPTGTERLDAKAHSDAMEVLRNFGFNKYQITGIEKGIDFVFSGFTTSNIRFEDMHPQHCFSVTIDLEYYLTDKC
jgi:hypothetical protein